MSIVHKYLYVSGSVFSGTDPLIRIPAKIPRIQNTGKKGAVIMASCFSKFNKKMSSCFKASQCLHPPLCCKLLCFYVCLSYVFDVRIWLIYGRSDLIAVFFWYSLYMYSTKRFAKESTTKFRGISRNFAKLKSLSSLFRISRNKKSYFATTLPIPGKSADLYEYTV
jgi:hypothetical protein